jgi:hypothetical protein
MRFRRTVLAVSITAAIATLSACGGGGGGGGLSYINNQVPVQPRSALPQVPYHTPVRSGTVEHLQGTGINVAITDIFTRDLNADSVDEVVFGGRQTQPATAATWRSSNISIFGWNVNNTFSNETAQWFQPGENTILGTEPSIKFGDFNGDGKPDMFVAPSTDMQHYGPGYVYINNGSQFSKQTLNFGNVWAHDSAIADFNQDGLADFLVTDYNGQMSIAFGTRTGTPTIAQATNLHGSAVAVGDFLNNGTITLIKTDNTTNANAGHDSKLLSISVNGTTITSTEIATLPASRFTLSKWNGIVNGSQSHEIRALPFDFDRDGKLDVIIISTPGAGGGVYNEIQFLKNNGSGNFTDVTDTVLVGYNTATMASYNPTLVDINGDGLMDIFLSAPDYNNAGKNLNTRILLQTQEGNFVDSYSDVFDKYWSQTWTMTGSSAAFSGVMQLVNGPNNEKYLVNAVPFIQDNTVKYGVYLSKIGSTGTVTAQATVATLQQIWPYMSAGEANTVLASTAFTNFFGYDPKEHGNGILDWMATLNPVGKLGISLTGRTGTRIPISGTLSVPTASPGLNQALTSISAVDELGRDFTVNLSNTVGQTDQRLQPLNWISGHNYRNSWVSKFTFQEEQNYQGLSYSGSGGNNYSVGADTSYINPNSDTIWRVSAAVIPTSPWIMLNGMWGEIRSSNNFEFSVIKKLDDFWLQSGMIYSTTQLTPGLVSKITPISSVYSVAGWSHNGFNLYGGFKPYIVDGNIELNLPTSVDNTGTMYYNKKQFKLRNELVGFAGVGYNYSYKNHQWTSGAIVDAQSQLALTVNYKVKF